MIYPSSSLVALTAPGIALLASALFAQVPARPVEPQAGQAAPAVQAPPAQEPAPPPTRPPGPARRAYRGLFGPRDEARGTRLASDLTVSVYGAYDDNVLASQAGGVPIDPRFQTAASYGGVSADATLARSWRRVALDAGGGSALRYYPDLTELTGATHYGTATFNITLGRRTTLRAVQGAAYSPYFGFGTGLGAQAGEDPRAGFAARPDYALTLSPALTLSSDGELTRTLGGRGSLSLTGSLRRVDFTNDDRQLSDRGLGARLSRSFTRNLALRVGYVYHEGDLAGFGTSAQRLRRHDVDLGFDYNRALGRTRRTTISLATGTSAIQTPEATYYRALANATLTREFGRSWNAQVDYRRGLRLIEGFPEPMFSDAVSLSSGGYLGSRFDLRATAAYTKGEMGFGAAGRGIDSYSGTVNGRFAIGRHLALYAEYLYYHYMFGENALLPAGLPRGLDRQGARVGVTTWLPVLR